MAVAEAGTRPALITLQASEPYRAWLGSLAQRLRAAARPSSTAAWSCWRPRSGTTSHRRVRRGTTGAKVTG